MGNDMQGSLNAVLMVLALLVTAYLCARFRTKRLTLRKCIYGILIGAAVAFFSWVLFVPEITGTCLPGYPLLQCFLPSVCLFTLIAFVKEVLWQRIAGTAMALLPFVLITHFYFLAYGPKYTGDPTYEIRKAERALHKVRVSLLRDSRSDDAYLHPGWLSQRLDLVLPEVVDTHYFDPTTYRTFRFWHTWLTGLHGVSGKMADIWYPGGRLSEVAGKVQMKVTEYESRH